MRQGPGEPAGRLAITAGGMAMESTNMAIDGMGIESGLDPDVRWMREALKLAREAARAGEVPVGAVVVLEGQLLGKGMNQMETLADPTAHAEILAIGAAASALGDHRLAGATLYVTLEPCVMCSGAIVLGRLARVVYAADDPRMGGCGSVYDICQDSRLDHRAVVSSGLLAGESNQLLRSFFESLRRGDSSQ